MAAEGWVTMTERILAIFGSKVMESRSNLGAHCRLTLAFLFVDVTFRSGDTRCWVRKSWISGPRFDVFCTPNLGEAPQIFSGAFVSRHHLRPTHQIWLRSHGWSFVCADEIKKITAAKYNGLAFGCCDWWLTDCTVSLLQMINKEFGGTVIKSDTRTDGQFKVNVDPSCPLFR